MDLPDPRTPASDGDPPPAAPAYDPRDFPPFAVTVDAVILTVDEGRLKVLLVRRGGEPHRGSWALPGGFKRPDETLDEAVRRELLEETRFVTPRRLRQFGAYGDPGRDPRTNVVTVAYVGAAPRVLGLQGGTDADDAGLFPVSHVRDGRLPVAFDHRSIVDDARAWVLREVEHGDLALDFVDEEFTLPELRHVYEALWRSPVDPRNFRRALTNPQRPFVEPTGRFRREPDSTGRPPELHRATDAWHAMGPLRRSRRVPSSPA
jgi:8-oxo-dGTP diphosphatase